ncbi:MAG: multidrug effflux MFS transporter [Acetobacter sp.]|nr:multidrug effflux MFS transporter [Acetobacter sp.]
MSASLLTRPAVILLGLVTAIGPLATDMYLPAFPQLEKALGGGNDSAQFTLGVWFLGLAAGQIFQGALSDRFGRKIPLIIGLFIFALASVGCAIVNDYSLFCFYRFLGALGGSVSTVIPRAVVRDGATGRKEVHIMAQLTLVFGVMPVLAPSLGSVVMHFGSWRNIFWLETLYAVLAIVGVLLIVPETLAVEQRIFLPLKGIIQRYKSIVREPVFLTNTLISSFATFVMFAYVSGAPAVFEQYLGFSPQMFGIFFGVNAAFFILGTQINSLLLHHVSLVTLLEGAALWVISMGCVFLILALSGFTGVLQGGTHRLFLCFLIIMMIGGLGFIAPNSTVLSLSRHGQHAGSASAMLGTFRFGLGFFSSVLVGWLPGSGAVPMATAMFIGALGIVCSAIARRLFRGHEHRTHS